MQVFKTKLVLDHQSSFFLPQSTRIPKSVLEASIRFWRGKFWRQKEKKAKLAFDPKKLWAELDRSEFLTVAFPKNSVLICPTWPIGQDTIPNRALDSNSSLTASLTNRAVPFSIGVKVPIVQSISNNTDRGPKF